MDRSLDAETARRVAAVLAARPEIRSYHDFKTRTGRIPHVDFHVVVAPEMTTRAVHDLFLALQDEIRAVVGPATKVLMHADPAGD
jgi:divalent metal cation (Fe/Co/Zn/Cd) transporter